MLAGSRVRKFVSVTVTEGFGIIECVAIADNDIVSNGFDSDVTAEGARVVDANSFGWACTVDFETFVDVDAAGVVAIELVTVVALA